MEDILALVIVVSVIALFGFAVWKLIQRIKRDRIKREEQRIASEKFWEDERKKKRNITVSTPMQGYLNTLDKAKPVKVPKPATRTYTSYTPTSSTSTSSSDDGFLTGMLVGMVIDSLTHKSGGSSPIDFPKTESSSSSSWGLDDDDSRKSISSSMSDSWSSSSSSDSWSSSDSGPSSDW